MRGLVRTSEGVFSSLLRSHACEASGQRNLIRQLRLPGLCAGVVAARREAELLRGWQRSLQRGLSRFSAVSTLFKLTIYRGLS